MEDRIYDVIIIGAGASGMNSALYSARTGMDVLLIDEYYSGGSLLDTAEVENYLGFKKVSGEDLAYYMHEQIAQYPNIERRNMTEVISAEKTKQQLFEVTTDAGLYTGKSMIIATGVKHSKLGLANESELEGNGVSYCAICDGNFYKDKHVIVVGGGNSAVEEGAYLADIARKVTVVHRRNEFRADLSVQHKLFSKSNVEVIWNATPSSIEASPEDEFRALSYIDKNSGEIKAIEADGMFVYVGIEPNTKPFENLINMDNGFISTDSNMETMKSGLFAVGDVRSESIRQVATAVGDGAIAGLQVKKYVDRLNTVGSVMNESNHK